MWQEHGGAINQAVEQACAKEAETGTPVHVSLDTTPRVGLKLELESSQSVHVNKELPTPFKVTFTPPAAPHPPVAPQLPAAKDIPRVPKKGNATSRPESLPVDPAVPDIDGHTRRSIQEHIIKALQRLEQGQTRIESRLVDALDQGLCRSSVTRAASDFQSVVEAQSMTGLQPLVNAGTVMIDGSTWQSHSNKEAMSDLVQRWQRVGVSHVTRRASCEASPTHEPDSSVALQARDEHPADVDELRWPATLKADWPKSLELRHTPVGDEKSDDRILRATSKARRQPSINSRIARQNEGGRNPRFVLFPTSPLRLAFDLLSVLALMYDLITIPIFITWDVTPGPELQAVQWMIASFWTLDILLSFRTGYVVDGAVEVRQSQIALHYLKSWFPAEFAVVAIDWVVLIIFTVMPGEMSRAGRTTALLRFSKLGRMLRLLGVARLAKLGDVFTRLLDRNISQTLLLAMQTGRMLLGIVYANHVIGCIWFYISHNVASDTGARWTDAPITGTDGTYEDTTFSFQYLSSLHWSLTQMTPGSMQINAQNTYERMFNIVCLIFGVLFFSSLISGLSAKMMQIRLLNQETAAKLSMLVKFLREKKVHSSLAFVVKQQAVERMNAKKPLLQKDVKGLSELSTKLQSELHFGLCFPLVTKHPVFLTFTHMLDPATHQGIYFKAMKFAVLASGDILFQASHDSSEAFIVNQGSLTYVQSPDTSLVLRDTERKIGHNAVMCEAALWTHWVHVGSAEAATCAEILVISCDELYQCGQKNILLGRFLFEYGVLFHRKLSETLMWGWDWPTDVSAPSCDPVGIMSSMPRQLQILVGLSAISLIENFWKWKFNTSLLRDLEQEVRHSVTTLIPDGEGECQRVVHLSAVRLQREDGYVFAVIGKWSEETGCIQAGCKLPGTKVKGWENQAVALQRLLDEDLDPLQDFILPVSMADENSYGKSEKYGIPTRYIKKVWGARMSPAFEFPESPFQRASWRSQRDGEFTIYSLADGPVVELYAWLSPSMFQNFESSAGKQELKHMLTGVTLKDTTPLRRGQPQRQSRTSTEGASESSDLLEF